MTLRYKKNPRGIKPTYLTETPGTDEAESTLYVNWVELTTIGGKWDQPRVREDDERP
jgi:hypothetical protein